MATLAVIAAAIVLLEGPVAKPATEDFAVKLDRPASIGEQYLESGTLDKVQSVVMTGGASPKRSEERHLVRFDLAVKILEVGQTGHVRHAVITVRQMTQETNGVMAELVEPGAIIDGRLENGKRVFELRSKAVSNDVREVLASAVNLRPDEPTDDQVMGSQQRRKVGESWPGSADLLLRVLGGDLKLDGQSITGSTTLVAKRADLRVPCLEYRSTIEATTLVPQDKLPPGVDAKKSRMTLSQSVLLPLDPALPPLGGDMTLVFTMQVQGAIQGSVVTTELNVQQVIHFDRSQMPKV
jgi:hypothetical protein